MIHIKNSKDGQFYIVTKAGNGEVLTVSETINRKSNAWKNIFSQAKLFHADAFEVKDETISEPVLYALTLDSDGNYTRWKTVNKNTSEA